MGWRRLVGEGAQTQGGMIWNSHIQGYRGRNYEVSLISEYIYINLICSQNVTLGRRLYRVFFLTEKKKKMTCKYLVFQLSINTSDVNSRLFISLVSICDSSTVHVKISDESDLFLRLSGRKAFKSIFKLFISEGITKLSIIMCITVDANL